MFFLEILAERRQKSISIEFNFAVVFDFKHPVSDAYIVRVIKSRRMRWAGNVARMGEGRGMYRDLVGKPERKNPSGRLRRRWEDNIKMDLQELGCEGMDWIELAEDRDRWRALGNGVMKLQFP